MAFTRGWNNATPAGTRAANEIDDAIREFKVDISERLISKIFNSMPNTTPEADLVVQPSILGNVTGKIMIFGAHILQNRQDEHDTQHQDNYTQLDIGETMNGCLILPPSIVITAFDATVDRQLSGTFTVEVNSINYLTGVATLIATCTRTANGVGLTTLGVNSFPYTLSNNEWISIHAVCSGSFHARFYGCRVTYNTTDCRNTI